MGLLAAAMVQSQGNVSQADTQTCVIEPLTEFQGHPERCSNPFCDAPMPARNKHAPVKLSCSDRCRMDRYVLRRAKAMVGEIGILEFNAILQRRSFRPRANRQKSHDLLEDRWCGGAGEVGCSSQKYKNKTNVITWISSIETTIQCRDKNSRSFLI
jgi:hypothetical protein